MLRLIMMLLMTLCLSAKCTSVNTRIVCAQIASHQIVPVMSCDISFKYDRCRCRCFDFNSWEALELNKCPEFPGKIVSKAAIDYPIETCEGVVGFFLEDAALKIRPEIKALHAIKGNLCQ